MDEHSHDELYPLETPDWNDEQMVFKRIMRQVVYQTQNIYFDAVRDTEDGSAVLCDLWIVHPSDGLEWKSWYSIDKVYLRELDDERLVSLALRVCTDIRDEKQKGEKAPPL